MPKRRAATHFAVVHYAGEVEYSGAGFCKKNKGLLYDELQLALATSTDPWLARRCCPP